MPTQQPLLTILQPPLTAEGFTNSGSDRYKRSVTEYSQILFDKSIILGEMDKAQNVNREITHEHVKAAAYSIANSYGKPVKPGWLIPLQVGQYACAILVGLAGGYLGKPVGLYGFIVAFVVGSVLFVIEKLNTK